MQMLLFRVSPNNDTNTIGMIFWQSVMFHNVATKLCYFFIFQSNLVNKGLLFTETPIVFMWG